MSNNPILSAIVSAEVRPAPHMDNLVSIYKSMEAASGINIFVTQNLASAKLSGKINQFHFLTIALGPAMQLIQCHEEKMFSLLSRYSEDKMSILC